MSPPDHARAVRDAIETEVPHAGGSQILAFPLPGRRPAMRGAYPDGGNFWDTIEADGRKRATRRSAFLISAVILHLLIASLFLITLSHDDSPPVEEAAIEMVEPPAPPPVEPPKAIETKQVEKPKPIIVPKPIPKLVLQIDRPPPVPMQTITPPVARQEPPPPAPSQASTAPQTYLGKLYAHLAANKRYPRAAQLAHVQGTAMLRFKMNHQGQVLSFHLEHGSGHSDLDDEVLAMIQRAQPLPIPPDEMPDPVELIVPVQFSVH